MTIIAFTSVRGGPGATTTALACAAVAGERSNVLFVEADPTGGVLLGRCDSLDGGRSLLQLAFPDRDERGRPGEVLVDAARQKLGDLDVIVAPANPNQAFEAIARSRSRWPQLLAELDATVVVDCGRLFPGTPATSLLRVADVVVVVASPDAADVLAYLEWSTGADLATGGAISGPVLVSVGPGRFGEWHLTRELGSSFAGNVVHAPAAVQLLWRGTSTRHRSLARTPFVRSVASLADTLERVAHHRDRQVRAS
jgi:hypothetical protein